MKLFCTWLAALRLSVTVHAAEITIAKPDVPLFCISFETPSEVGADMACLSCPNGKNSKKKMNKEE